MVRFYDLQQDEVEDNIVEDINDLLMKSHLSYLCIRLSDTRRIRSKKVKKIKLYLVNHP